MEVILLKKVLNLGYKNDIVTVKGGFANNYLIPKGLAEVANAANKKRVAEVLNQTKHKEEKKMKKALHLQEALQVADLELPVAASSEGRVFGAVTPEQISEYLQTKGYDVAPDQIAIPGTIKQLGDHSITITLYKEVQVAPSLKVVQKPE